MKLNYGISDRPPFPRLISLALQQMMAILTATTALPMLVGHGVSPAAAMFGAGAGTFLYLLLTGLKSPMFLGSSFTFLGCMLAAFAGGVSVGLGMLGLIIGATAAGLVYVVLAIVVRRVGVGWIERLMPPVVIGPSIAIIGLSLAGNAVSNMRTGNVMKILDTGASVPVASEYVTIICALVTLAVTIISSVYGNNILKLIPFLMGMVAGYAVAALFTVAGNVLNIDALKIVDFEIFSRTMFPDGKVSLASFISVPDFVFIKAIDGVSELSVSYVITIITAYIPVALAAFAEHIGDHKNLSSIIGKDLLKDPGMERTLLGDGLGSIVGAFFGGCPNTTYGEAIACVALTGNASTITTLAASLGCIGFAFFTPFMAFISSMPSCVMGGICVAAYGFITASGLRMIQNIDLNENRNIFVISVILITGAGQLSLNFGAVTITEVASALVLGILTNLIVSRSR